jgi:CubicO group peptidase (beta-lactamase class C family)
VNDDRVPRAESAGGWALARTPEEVRAAGMDPERLAAFDRTELALFAGETFSLTVIRHGLLVHELRGFNVVDDSRFDIWSCTKSFTGLAYLFLLEAAAEGALERPVGLESKAYELIPEGLPLTDARKADVTIDHLLTMSGGFVGEAEGILGTPTDTGVGLFEFALGHAENRRGDSAAQLARDPGTSFDYSDAGFSHLSLAFARAMGREIDEVVAERVFAPLGIERVSWSRAGGGDRIGPHTVPHTGLVLSSRDLARVGLLLLRRGRWGDRQVLPEAWLDVFLRSSPQNPSYGRTFWLNAGGRLFPGLPEDLFGMFGFRSNRLYVVPSLDLVIARTTAGPIEREEGAFLETLLATTA